jgi:8-oxo-dGTP pyrophosphatase MutT (NUDIX family)
MLTTLDAETVRELAIKAGVCVRPVLSQVTDTVTGDTKVVPIACGSTRESQCPPCAERNRWLRMQQCREGWHLDEEPAEPPPADEDDPDSEDEAASEADGSDRSRRVRSTRRRQDVPDLPRLPVENRTVGRTFIAPDGRVWRPSMFLTVTLPSYGRVTIEGVPVDPASYDYRRAALDAMHFAKLVDRFWQNLRRAVGYQVQYFATVEPQRRLAPHLHAAIRGAIPRALLRQVVAATYHQLWWPPHHEPVYTGDQLPTWNDDAHGYCDPATGEPLPTWGEALDRLEGRPDGEPAHVVRFGRQLDLQGIIAGSSDADRRVGYLTKYLTKSISETYDDDQSSEARRAHLDRLAHEVRWLPCSPRCANWLRYGVQPQNASSGMAPGWCRSKAHDREHLGLGGRRVLVSRRWTGKTLDQHGADRAAIVRAVLEEAGIDPDDHNTYSATVLRPDGQPRYHWSPVNPSDLGDTPYARVIAHTIRRRQRWREQYEAAKARAAPRADLSATAPAATAA